MSRYCTSCGSAATADETTCSVCGEPLPPVESPEQKNAAAQSAAAAPGPPRKRSALGDYMIGIVGVALVALLAYFGFSKEEVKGPNDPRYDQQAQGQTQGAPGAGGGQSATLPPGHPQTSAPAGPTAEQLRTIAEMKKQVAASPDDLQLKLQLANMLYDVNLDAEAVPLYRAYLKTYPSDTNARTDMAVSIANSGNVDSAIIELAHVMRDNPHYQPAAFNLSIMYYNKHNQDSMTYWLKRVVEIDSTSRQGTVALSLLRRPAPADSAHGLPSVQ